MKSCVKSMVVGYIMMKLGVAAVKAKSLTFFGRLDIMGSAVVMARGRRRRALDQEKIWARERRADAFAAKLGYKLLKRGFDKLD